MVSPTKRTVQLVAAFIELANRFNAGGWVEYLFWETLEGLREKPFPFFEPLTSEEMEMLRALRDEAALWLSWQNGKWNPVAIGAWREHTARTPSEDILQGMQRA